MKLSREKIDLKRANKCMTVADFPEYMPDPAESTSLPEIVVPDLSLIHI